MYLAVYLRCFVLFVLLSHLLVAKVSAEQQSTPKNICQFSKSDQLWLQQATKAWDNIVQRFPLFKIPGHTELIFFDGICQGQSSYALLLRGKHQSQLHLGRVTLPSGAVLPASTIAFTSFEAKQQQAFFVMSLPSVWRRAGYSQGLKLESFLTAVMLHEMSHLFHLEKLMPRLTHLMAVDSQIHGFNDDTVQYLFASNKAFKHSVSREISLLLKASRDRDEIKARNYLTDAMSLLQMRYQKWFTGKYQTLQQASPIWLTAEVPGNGWVISG